MGFLKERCTSCWIGEYWAKKKGAGVVLDVGAKTGEFSLWIYPYAEKIFALEPAGELFPHLEKNVKGWPKIQALKLSLSGSNEDQKLLGDVMSGGARLGQGDGGQMVKSRTLATFMEERNIEMVDILKIDIENGESDVFGSSDFPWDKVRFVIGEHLGSLRGSFESNGFKMDDYRHGFTAKRKELEWPN